MRKRRKCSGQELLHRLQGQEDQNVRETFQDQHQQSTNNELDNQIEDHTLESSSIPNENVSQQKEEPLLIKVRDICTGEIIIRKMVVDQVWHLEKTQKVVLEIGGNGQGNDNGSNLPVRFLGKLAQRSAYCPISVERWDEMSEDSSRAQWKKSSMDMKRLRSNLDKHIISWQFSIAFYKQNLVTSFLFFTKVVLVLVIKSIR